MTRPWLLLAAALAAACRPDCTLPAGETRPNVVLVTVDTLRADHVGCYGSATVRTPAFDRLGAEGVLFTRAYSQTHVTIPSHLSIFTSLPLAEHGVPDNVDAPVAKVESLATAFAAGGWRLAAFVGAKHVGAGSPLGPVLAPFEQVHGPKQLTRPLRADETNAALFPWLRQACGRPFFTWVHYWDPHMPYQPPAPFDRAYYAGDPRDPAATSMERVTLGWFFYDLSDLRRHLQREAHQVRALKRDFALSTRQVRRGMLDPLALPAALGDRRADARARLRPLATAVRRDLPYRPHLADWLTGVRDLRYPLAQYAGEVSYVDRALGALTGELERLGIAGRTIVLVTADHGEGHGEHGVWFDHYGLQEENVRVPLLVWAPGRLAPARRTDLARGIDVAPTLLRLAGLPVPATMRGRDLLAGPPEAAPVVLESARGTQLAAVDGRWKLIQTRQSFWYLDDVARDAGALELFDLEADPGERTNLAAARPDVAAPLVARLDAWAATHSRLAPATAATAAPVAPALREQLRALGYAE
ncbi:MAG: sulfatase [Candidatus Binatia bacterium]